MIGGRACAKEVPAGEPIEQDTATTESSDKDSIIRKQLQEAIDKELKNQQGALVALYLDSGEVDDAASIGEYRCYSRPGRGGSYSGIRSIPFGTAWTIWERVSQSSKREIVIDPGPPYKTFTTVVTLVPGQVTNLGRIVLEKVKIEGTASICGTIRDENGSPLEGVKVSSIKGFVYTNAEGFYRIDGFERKECELLASKDGYVPHRKRIYKREMYERPDKQDLVLSYARKVRFRYVISPEGKDDFGDSSATTGVAEYLVDTQYFRIPSYQIEPGDFRDFVVGAAPAFRLNDSELILQDFDQFIFYKSLPSSSDQFEAISRVDAGSFKSRSCPPIEKGDVILIDEGRTSGYTLKILFEEVRTLDPSEYKLSSKAQPIRLKVSYGDFPPELRAKLDKRKAEMSVGGGICIAGRARFSDGATITNDKDIKVNLHDDYGADIPLRVYEGGWFVMDRVHGSNIAGPERGFVLRAFGYDPIDALVTVWDKEITYVGFEMKKTPPGKLGSVKGVVQDRHGRSVEGAYVNISFPFAYSGPRPEMRIQTDASGEYFFEGLSGGKHELYSSKNGYAPDWEMFMPPEGATGVKDLKLYPRHRILIDYVYQADGSRNFTSGDLKTGTINWGLYEGSLDLSDGKIERSGPGEDLRLYQEKGVLYFRIFYAGGPNGFYDAGAVPLDSVTEAAGKGYTTQGNRPCKVGHVYVVRTREEDNYAKFIVKSMEAF